MAVFGLGGVGGYVVEALCRSGVGQFTLVDPDKVALSNLNRQILATRSNLGQYKTQAARERIADINPQARVECREVFFSPETRASFAFSRFDYVVDAIDTVTGKIQLILDAQAAGVPVISSMGAGNKTDPSAFEVADLSKTSMCPLARIMRKELRKRGVEHVKVVYSRQPPLPPAESAPPEELGERRQIPGSLAYVPGAAGLLLAGEVVHDLIGVPIR